MPASHTTQRQNHQVSASTFRKEQSSSKVSNRYFIKPYLTEKTLQLGTTSYESLGAHLITHEGVQGVNFAVWAPHASSVSVVGDFNDWNPKHDPMWQIAQTGVWELFIPGIKENTYYQYSICHADKKTRVNKSDPYAFYSEVRPKKASIVAARNTYTWRDAAFIKSRISKYAVNKPISIYEVHLGSWKLPTSNEGSKRWLSYRELAKTLIPYVKEMGYTHIEPLPITEHPHDGSWGYQLTGQFSPTSRFGSPDDFKYFIDEAHAAGLGIILDWVPGHFAKDEHGLGKFDGTALYESSDPARSEIPSWGTYSFDLDKKEVRDFLLSSAYFWFKEYHIDGLRVDAVSSMVYLDFSYEDSAWKPNALGGNENLSAVTFFKSLNRLIHSHFPGVMMIAEESNGWPRVTGPNKKQSLGFDFKWNMGWMHDTLTYFKEDFAGRTNHHSTLTFPLVYAFNESHVLPFSHDEVVHLKRPLLLKSLGSRASQFSQLRSLYAYMFSHPGKKLLFMGSELGALTEWNESTELDWSLLKKVPHKKLQAFVKKLNSLYTQTPALYEKDTTSDGFEWISVSDSKRSVISYIRKGKKEFLISVSNFSEKTYENYALGVPKLGTYKVILSSDEVAFGGTTSKQTHAYEAKRGKTDTQPYFITLNVPASTTLYIKKEA